MPTKRATGPEWPGQPGSTRDWAAIALSRLGDAKVVTLTR